MIVPLEKLEVSERTAIILLSEFSPPMLIALKTLFITLSSIFRSRVALEESGTADWDYHGQYWPHHWAYAGPRAGHTVMLGTGVLGLAGVLRRKINL